MFTLRSSSIVVRVTLLICLATVSAAQSDDVPQTCSVTKPSDHPFIPPSPYPREASRGGGSFWFGTARLWTILPATGTWRRLPHYNPSDLTYRQKLSWFREGYNWRTELTPKLTITGRRLDPPAPPLAADQANNAGITGDRAFMMVGINLPTLGCWEITGHYKGEKLSYVVWVAE